jgi:TolB protein
MEELPTQLNAEFKSHWDVDPGPSWKVAQYVSTQARKIPTQQRFASTMKLVTGLAAIVVLAFFMNFMVSRLQSASMTANGTPFMSSEEPSVLLAFTSKQDGNAEIYIMHADGTGMVNLTNDPANDSFPFWSPDGRQIAFMSDRDGSTQIYLMDADGSNVTRLTEGEGDYVMDANGNSPWSADGSKLIVSHMVSGEQTSQLQVVDIAEKSTTPLTNEPGEYVLSSWSADGTHIAFVSSERGRAAADLYVVGNDGNDLVKLTETLPPGEYFSFDYEWSLEGSSIFFATHKNEQVYQDAMYFSTIYRSGADGIKEIAAQITDRQIIDWWDGGNIRLELSERMMHWTRSDGSDSQLELCKKSSDMKGMAFERSHTGNLVFGFDCIPDGWMLYWIPPDAATAELLLDRIIPLQQDSLFGLTFSSAERHLAFVTLDSTSVDLTETLYIVDVAKAREDPSTEPLRLENSFGQDWQPIANREVVEEEPTPGPTHTTESEDVLPISPNISNGEWISFIGGRSIPDAANSMYMTTEQDVFLIHPDGSGLVNITNSPDFYVWLQWSPNGNDLLFLRMRNSGNMDILRKNGSSSFDVLVSTSMSFDPSFHYSWSPNSEQIAFVDRRSGNLDIYTMYANGRNDPQITQLTDDPAQDFGFVWSPDGDRIAFQRLDGDKLSVHVMNKDGSNPHEVAQGMGRVWLYWSHDGKVLYASGGSQLTAQSNWLACEGCSHNPAIYRMDPSGSSVEQIYAEPEYSQVGFHLYDTPENTLYLMRVEPQPFLEFWGTWFRFDGTSVQQIDPLDPQQTCKTTDGNILSEDISPDQRFSIVTNFCAGGFDLYLVDRETPQPELRHLTQLPLDTWGQGGDFAYLPITWSPDGRWIVYDDGHGSMLLLDLEKAMQDPNTQPVTLIEPILYEGQSGQMFQSPESIVVIDLVWQPKP